MVAKFKGKFDAGWDKYREEIFARQKELGIVPQNAKLAPKPADIKDWDKLSADEKKLFARQMEIFAASQPIPTTRSGASSKPSKIWASSTTP